MAHPSGDLAPSGVIGAARQCVRHRRRPSDSFVAYDRCLWCRLSTRRGVHPHHTERLAAYWSEQLGGPTTYTKSLGDYSYVVRRHSGNGLHEQMDGRAVAAFVFALDDVAIPTDARLRFQLIAWFTWATAMLNHRWTTIDQVPDDLPMPRWDWNGTEGW
jgi:hemoglobin